MRETIFCLTLLPLLTAALLAMQGLPPASDQAGPFVFFGEVKAADKKYEGFGYVDKSGKVSILPKYRKATAFIGRVATVAIGRGDNERWGYINPDGSYLIKPRFVLAEIMTEERAAVKTSLQGDWGYVDKSGKSVIKEKYLYARPFSEGLAAVATYGGEAPNKWNYIDSSGKTVLTPKIQQGFDFKEGMALVRFTDDSYGHIDRKGKRLSTKPFDWAGDFAEGLALVRLKEKVQYIDTSGKIVIKTKYSLATGFSDGLAIVSTKKGNGYINKKGKLVIKAQFENAMPFNEGRARVQKGGNDMGMGGWYFINKKGKRMTPDFEMIASDMVGGMAFVIAGDYVSLKNLKGKKQAGPFTGFINKAGKMVYINRER